MARSNATILDTNAMHGTWLPSLLLLLLLPSLGLGAASPFVHPTMASRMGCSSCGVCSKRKESHWATDTNEEAKRGGGEEGHL